MSRDFFVRQTLQSARLDNPAELRSQQTSPAVTQCAARHQRSWTVIQTVSARVGWTSDPATGRKFVVSLRSRIWQLVTEEVIIDLPAGADFDELMHVTYDAGSILIPIMPSDIDVFCASRFIANLLLVARVKTPRAWKYQ
jgi:hypothetical protein